MLQFLRTAQKSMKQNIEEHSSADKRREEEGDEKAKVSRKL